MSARLRAGLATACLLVAACDRAPKRLNADPAVEADALSLAPPASSAAAPAPPLTQGFEGGCCPISFRRCRGIGFSGSWVAERS